MQYKTFVWPPLASRKQRVLVPQPQASHPVWPPEHPMSTGHSMRTTGQGAGDPGTISSFAAEDIPEDKVYVSVTPYVWNEPT